MFRESNLLSSHLEWVCAHPVIKFGLQNSPSNNSITLATLGRSAKGSDNVYSLSSIIIIIVTIIVMITIYQFRYPQKRGELRCGRASWWLARGAQARRNCDVHPVRSGQSASVILSKASNTADGRLLLLRIEKGGHGTRKTRDVTMRVEAGKDKKYTHS